MADKNLTIKIRGDNAALSRSLQQSRSGITKFGGFLKSFGSKFGLLGAGLVGTAAGGLGAGLSIKVFTGAIEEVDRLTKLGKQFGLTTEEVQKFRRVAIVTGTNLQQILKGFGALTKQIVQFSRDGTGEGAKVFKELGLGADELSRAFKEGPVQVLSVFGEALKKVENPLRRSALLEELLGARNKQLAVVLADVATVFGSVDKAFSDLSLGLTKEETDAVELFRDTWAEIADTIDNKVLKSMSRLAGALQPFSSAMKALLEDVLIGGIEGIGESLRKLGRSINTLGGPAFQALLSGNPLGRGVQAAGFAFQAAGQALLPSAGGGAGTRFGLSAGMAQFQANARALGFPGSPALGQAAGPRFGLGGLDRGQLPAAGTGIIGGLDFGKLVSESQTQTGLLEKISSSVAGGFIKNETTGVVTAVAAP